MSRHPILDATPEPPPSEIDPVDLLARADQMVGERAKLIEAGVGVEIDGGELELLKERESRWVAAIERARRVVAERMGAARRLGRYR